MVKCSLLCLFLAPLSATFLETIDSLHHLDPDAITVIEAHGDEDQLKPILSAKEMDWSFFPYGTIAWNPTDYEAMARKNGHHSNWVVLKEKSGRKRCYLVGFATGEDEEGYQRIKRELKEEYPGCIPLSLNYTSLGV